MPLACYAFCRRGISLAQKLKSRLGANPAAAELEPARIYAPARFAGEQIDLAFDELGSALAETFGAKYPHLFIGAAGIAVRALAPLLVHKSEDPPVMIMDPAGRNIISLLSGHWGGANRLTRLIAEIMQANPVIADATDSAGAFALDLYLQQKNARIRDWDALPPLQGAALDGRLVPLWDPAHLLPRHPAFSREDHEGSHAGLPVLGVHWRRLRGRRLMRIALPALHIGMGFRKGASFYELQEGFEELIDLCNIERSGIAALATIDEKARDANFQDLADSMDLPVRSFTADELAKIPTPNPASACGKRFGKTPFSVAEAAALLSARTSMKEEPYANALERDQPEADLAVEKIILKGKITFAAAIIHY